MNDNNPIVIIICAVIALALLCVFTATTTLADLTATNAARVAEAQAQAAAAVAAQAQAQADIERAAGERAVLEAAARAVDNNTALVDFYAKRGDRRALAVWLWALALLGGGVALGSVRGVWRFVTRPHNDTPFEKGREL